MDTSAQPNATDPKNTPPANAEKPKPPFSALAGILGNALNSTLKYSQAGAGLETRKCPQCSAARPADTNLQFCAFCGYQFF